MDTVVLVDFLTWSHDHPDQHPTFVLIKKSSIEATVNFWLPSFLIKILIKNLFKKLISEIIHEILPPCFSFKNKKLARSFLRTQIFDAFCQSIFVTFCFCGEPKLSWNFVDRVVRLQPFIWWNGWVGSFPPYDLGPFGARRCCFSQHLGRFTAGSPTAITHEKEGEKKGKWSEPSTSMIMFHTLSNTFQ